MLFHKTNATLFIITGFVITHFFGRIIIFTAIFKVFSLNMCLFQPCCASNFAKQVQQIHVVFLECVLIPNFIKLMSRQFEVRNHEPTHTTFSLNGNIPVEAHPLSANRS